MALSSKPSINFLSEPIQYRPGQPKNRETSKLIRSHVAETIRRKKRSQLVLNMKKGHAGTVSGGAFCTCLMHRQSTSRGAQTVRDLSRAVRKAQVMADSYKICQTCHLPQFTELSWLGQLKVAKAWLPSVVPFMEAEFDPFSSLPELAGLGQSKAAARALNEFKAHLITFWSYDILRSVVLPEAAKDPALFMALLYSSCAHLNAMQDGGETSLSMAIKAETMRQINIRLNDPKKRNTGTTIASIGYLSSGVWAYGSDSMKEVQAHENAMITILSEGLHWATLEGDVVGGTLVHCLALHEFSRAAILALPIRIEWIVTFLNIDREISDTDWLPESPLYCPRLDFYSLKEISRCSEETLQILRSVRSLIDPVIGNSTNKDYDTIRATLLAMPPIRTAVAGDKIFSDYTYESCRLTALIMIEAMDARTSFVNVGTSTLEPLKLSLQKTDIGSYWGKMSGVLYWIALVASAAAVGKPQHCFMNSIIVRGDHDLCYRNSVFEGATTAAYNLNQLHLYLKMGDVQPPTHSMASSSPSSIIILETD